MTTGAVRTGQACDRTGHDGDQVIVMLSGQGRTVTGTTTTTRAWRHVPRDNGGENEVAGIGCSKMRMSEDVLHHREVCRSEQAHTKHRMCDRGVVRQRTSAIEASTIGGKTPCAFDSPE